MKIVRIIARLNVGGPARHVVWLTSELQDQEFCSTLVAGTVPPGEEDMSYLARESGVEPIYIPEMSRELTWRDAIVVWKLFRLLRQERPDIVHTHTAKAGTVGRAAAALYKLSRPAGAGVKVVHTFHGHVFHSYYGPLKTKLFVAIERALARFATDKIITISDQQQKEILERFRIGTRRQHRVIALGIDLAALIEKPADRASLRNELGATADEIIVGFVGRLTEIKNVQMLIRVAERYVRPYPADSAAKLRFVIVGDGHLRAKLESEASARGVSSIFHFAGNRTDVAALYAAMDIVALTSKNEGTPLSVIEGMAARRPFVATNVGGVADLLGSECERRERFSICANGVSTAADDDEGFLAGLLYLAENEKLRHSTAQMGRRFVEERYAKPVLVNNIKNLYREIAG